MDDTALHRRGQWFPRQETRWVDSFETRMLFEDFHNSVVPYRHEPEAYELSTDGIPWYTVDEALTLGHDGWRLDGFLRTVATRLLTNHEVWLEVALEDGHDQGKPFSVWLVDGVERLPQGGLVQVLPPRNELADWWGVPDDWPEQISLDPSSMVHATLPGEYPSGALDEVMQRLAEIEVDITPNWLWSHWEGSNPDAPRPDLTELSRTQRLAVLQAAAPDRLECP